jgi:hypothetical protein
MRVKTILPAPMEAGRDDAAGARGDPRRVWQALARTWSPNLVPLTPLFASGTVPCNG